MVCIKCVDPSIVSNHALPICIMSCTACGWIQLNSNCHGNCHRAWVGLRNYPTFCVSFDPTDDHLTRYKNATITEYCSKTPLQSWQSQKLSIQTPIFVLRCQHSHISADIWKMYDWATTLHLDLSIMVKFTVKIPRILNQTYRFPPPRRPLVSSNSRGIVFIFFLVSLATICNRRKTMKILVRLLNLFLEVIGHSIHITYLS